MQRPFCERCGSETEPSSIGSYYCLRCGLAYSYQWVMPDGARMEPVTCRYTLPDKAEYRTRLAALERQKGAMEQELAGIGLLRGLRKRRALCLSLSLLQKQIRAIEACL